VFDLGSSGAVQRGGSFEKSVAEPTFESKQMRVKFVWLFLEST
jgi:hypothetical protein